MAINPNDLGHSAFGRISYEHFWDGKENDSGVTMHTATLIFRKDSPDTIAFIEEMSGKGKALAARMFPGVQFELLGFPLRDGDNPTHNVNNVETLKGHYYINFSRAKPVEVCDVNMQPIIDRSRVYAGVWARVNYILTHYNNKGKRGVGVRMLHMQLGRDDTRLGGMSAAQAFKDAPVANMQGGTVPISVQDLM